MPEQPFRIIPATGRIIYAHKHLYRPKLQFGNSTSQVQVDLLRIVSGVPELSQGWSEKGDATKPDGSGWADDCLFGLIDRKGVGTALAPHLVAADFLICDDMNKESADFIAVSEREAWIKVIHAKAAPKGERKPLSASALHDVCGQAQKNLHYVDSFAGVRPPNFKRWNGAWSAPKVKGKVKRRLRRTTDDADKCWARASAVLSNPLSRREIVILMSNILSRNMLEAQSKLDDPEPEAFQIFYQLSSTWSACASMGAGLRLFCMP